MEPMTKPVQDTNLAKDIQGLLHMQYSSDIQIEEQKFTAVETSRVQYPIWETHVSVIQWVTNIHA